MNWKDYTTIAAVIFVIVILGTILFQLPIAQLADWRPATGLLIILALVIFFTISPLFADTSKPESIAAALLSVSALAQAFLGLVFNNQALFISFCINLILLWSLTIYYHIQSGEGRHLRQ